MKNLLRPIGISVFLSFFFLVFSINFTEAQNGRIAQRIASLQQKGVFSQPAEIFIPATTDPGNLSKLKSLVSSFSLFELNTALDISSTKPDYLNFIIPATSGRSSLHVMLFKQDISPNGFSLLTSDGKKYNMPGIVHYRGSIDGDPNSIAAFSFTKDEVSGMISNGSGNYVFGKLSDQTGKHIFYNDIDLREKPPIDCATNTNIPHQPKDYLRGAQGAASLTTKCVNWYWETDYDIYTSKQSSVTNVTTFIQAIFNQVSTLYANDGASITLKTLYIWTTTDPYTGPSTSNYLDQFGVNRTTFDGDLATLIGYQGGGGVAWIDGLCRSSSQNKYKMAYTGISSSYNSVPTYSWTVEVITHEQGHQLGSSHTHDCVWNGNNTKIDGCGDSAGYPSGSCALPSPALPPGGGTIMSYCHLTSVGIKFNLGFGPQPTALIIDNINTSSCLANCTSGCNVPVQPGAISGNAATCSATSQTYSVAAVSGATSYTWTLPSGWTGTSTTNSITVTTGTTSGNITVTAVNSCGNSTVRTLAVTLNTTPAQPGSISGNSAVCSTVSQTYSVTAVSGATSYTWTLPSGWTGTSTTNSITVTTGSGAGNITVKANNNCGSSSQRTMAVTITSNGPGQPGNISGATSACQSSNQTYSVAAVSGATSYTWTLPSGWSGTSTTNSISATVGSAAGNITVIANNGCGSGAARTLAVTISPVPAKPATITVNNTAAVCPGNTRTYTISPVSGASSYTWTAPTGGTITSGQGSTTIAVSYNSNFIANGTLSVVANNACGSSSAKTLTVAINKPASPASITGPVTVCSGAITTYTAATVAGATSYIWTLPSGASIQGAATGNTINVLWGSRGGTLAVKASNGCAVSGSRSIKVTVNCTSPMVKTTIQSSMELYPNPASGFANIRFYSEQTNNYTISISDVAGKKLINKKIVANAGINIQRIDLAGLAKGSYFVTIENTNERKVIKLQVQ